jgi:hypothetical protein
MQVRRKYKASQFYLMREILRRRRGEEERDAEAVGNTMLGTL